MFGWVFVQQLDHMLRLQAPRHTPHTPHTTHTELELRGTIQLPIDDSPRKAAGTMQCWGPQWTKKACMYACNSSLRPLVNLAQLERRAGQARYAWHPRARGPHQSSESRVTSVPGQVSELQLHGAYFCQERVLAGGGQMYRQGTGR